MRRGFPRPHIATLLLVGFVAVAAILMLGHHAPPGPRFAAATPSWRGLVGGPRVPALAAQPSVAQKVIVVLRARSLADHVGAAGGEVTSAQEQGWESQARSDQHTLLQQLSFRGASLQPIFRYTRVLNGVAAAVDPSTLGVLEHAPEVAGIYPVRVAYPATVSTSILESAAFGPGSGRRPEVGLRGADGRGVQIALLDTGIDPSHPYLRGQIHPGLDVVGGDPGALAAPNPDDRTQIEEHATELAGLLVGAGGPGGLIGVAPGATLLPIRVAGWQHDATGHWSVFATTDQIVEGLEQAVDPNQDGDAHDAARVALLGVAEPFASFRDEPAARAVEGSLRLDMLVVSPAGNDGPAGPSFGDVAGPGGAPDGLSVGALDARPRTNAARVVITAGLDTIVNEDAPLATEGAATRQVSLPLVAVAPAAGVGRNALDPLPIERFFDRSGFSIAAGRAVLVAAAGNGGAVARNAVSAGAGAVVLVGGPLPAGAVTSNAPLPVPVISVDEQTGKRLLAGLRRHERLALVVGVAHEERNPAFGRVAGFSSRGLALSRRLKPELVAPGVELATSEAGLDAAGAPRYATVSGTSASAALVAGAAALLAQARPDLDAAELRAALAESARPGRDSLLTEGSGALDVEAASKLPGVARPATLDFGRASKKRRWSATRRLAIRNTTGSTLTLFVALHQHGAAAAVTLEPVPDRTLTIPAHETRTLSLLARFEPAYNLPGRSAQGVVELQSTGGVSLRIPWTLALPLPARQLLGPVTLSKKSIRPSDSSVAVLSVDVGKILTIDSADPAEPAKRIALVPAARLALDLWNEAGQRLGTLVVLRNVLPGRYSFGITGRSPAGADLEAGTYTIHVVARPVEGGRRSLRIVGFTVLAGPTPTTTLVPP
jgi:subtilisin family serine protease